MVDGGGGAGRTAVGPLWTDLYELRMAASFLRRGFVAPATFSLFIRHLPPERGFLVSAGLADCLAFLEALRFGPHDIVFLRERLGFPDRDVAALAELRFTGDVWAIPEGRIVFAEEPLLEVTSPIAEGQIVETWLLNQISFQTTIASKAARVVLAAAGRPVVDFSFRRTQGPEAAMAVARTSSIVGVAGTSNVEAARRYDLPAVGTMAHSYIEAFPNEEDAFRAFGEDFPGGATFLVDTYDTLEGVRAAVRVIDDLGLPGPLGIRLDSGDLDVLARGAREILDHAGHRDVRILASGSLDEYAIDRLVCSGAPIDAFGVGTKMGVSADAPYLDSVYKLVSYANRPVMKLSSGKATAPGAKQVFRGRLADGDLVGLRDEWPPDGRTGLLEPVMIHGRRVKQDDGIELARRRFQADLAALPAAARSIVEPVAPPVTRTARLEALIAQTAARLAGRASRGDRPDPLDADIPAEPGVWLGHPAEHVPSNSE